MDKLKVAVLVGGKSAEHEISIATACEVLKHLNPPKYEAFPVYISKDGFSWQILSKNEFFILQTPIKSTNKKKPEAKKSLSIERVAGEGIAKIKKAGVDIVFIALHGPFGEDGTVQGFLELFGIPYTGSKVLASALGMDKIASRKIFDQAGLIVPKYLIIQKGENSGSVWKQFSPPVFVKPSNQGSAIGASLAKRKDEIEKALKLAHSYSDAALIEEYLDGVEVTCGILGNENPTALPLVEICPKHEFFDYETKYNANLCEEIVPARLPAKLTQKAQNAALIAYKSIGCRAFGRVDMIVKTGVPHILEINTIPGLTSVSLVPKAAKAAGISYSQLLGKIITFSLVN